MLADKQLLSSGLRSWAISVINLLRPAGSSFHPVTLAPQRSPLCVTSRRHAWQGVMEESIPKGGRGDPNETSPRVRLLLLWVSATLLLSSPVSIPLTEASGISIRMYGMILISVCLDGWVPDPTAILHRLGLGTAAIIRSIPYVLGTHRCSIAVGSGKTR